LQHGQHSKAHVSHTFAIMQSVLKLQCNGSFHRLPLAEDDFSYKGVDAAIKKLWPHLGAERAKYKDDEGDMCSLSQVSFPDFVNVAKTAKSNVYKVWIRDPEVSEHQGHKQTEQQKADWANHRGAMKAHASDHHNVHWDKWQQSNAKHWKHNQPQSQEVHWEAREAHHDAKKHDQYAQDSQQQQQHQEQEQEQKQEQQHETRESWKSNLKQCHAAIRALWILGVVRKELPLTGKVCASVATFIIPRAIAYLTANTDEVEVDDAVVKDILRCVEQIPVLASCHELNTALNNASLTMRERLLALLTRLNEVEFQHQVGFIKKLYGLQKENLDHALDNMEKNIPSWMMESPSKHESLVCGNCQAWPIRGPRFRSQSWDSFDLCAECYASKPNIRYGKSANHTFRFELLPAPAHEAPSKEAPEAEDQVMKPCASGCGFAATWHDTHCCTACMELGCHGPLCECKPYLPPKDKVKAVLEQCDIEKLMQ